LSPVADKAPETVRVFEHRRGSAEVHGDGQGIAGVCRAAPLQKAAGEYVPFFVGQIVDVNNSVRAPLS
jgi:hypothetical protein